MSDQQTTNRPKTYSSAEVAELCAGDSMKCPERWLIRQIVAKRIQAMRIGRHWRFTEEQLAQALATFSNGVEITAAAERPHVVGLSAASMRRRVAS